MEIPEIIAELEYYKKELPETALKNAIEKQEEITPILLETLEKWKNKQRQLRRDRDYFLHIYALFLLAQFKEPRAYPLIIEFFYISGDICMDTVGDVVTEDLGRILASVSQGDIEPVKPLIENPQVNEYVRGAGIECLMILVAEGVISREVVVEYFQELFSEKLEREFSFIWTVLVINSAELYPLELQDSIREIFELDLVDEFFINQKDIARSLKKGQEETLKELREKPRYSFIEDTIQEMKNWYCFQPPKKQASGFGSTDSSSSSKSKFSQKKAKQKMQKKSRRKNRSKNKK